MMLFKRVNWTGNQEASYSKGTSDSPLPWALFVVSGIVSVFLHCGIVVAVLIKSHIEHVLTAQWQDGSEVCVEPSTHSSLLCSKLLDCMYVVACFDALGAFGEISRGKGMRNASWSDPTRDANAFIHFNCLLCPAISFRLMPTSTWAVRWRSHELVRFASCSDKKGPHEVGDTISRGEPKWQKATNQFALKVNSLTGKNDVRVKKWLMLG